MGEIIPLPLRARDANAASRFEMIGGQLHHATMLTFPQSQLRDIRNVWGVTVEGPPRIVPDAVPFSDGRPLRAKAVRAKVCATKTAASKQAAAKRKPVCRAPK